MTTEETAEIKHAFLLGSSTFSPGSLPHPSRSASSVVVVVLVPMSERVEQFVQEFGAAIDAQRLFAESKPLVEAARRQAGQLSSTLDRLAVDHGAPRSVSSADLHALEDELATFSHPPLGPLMDKARALLQVVEDGFVDGDPGELRRLLSDAEMVLAAGQRQRGAAQRHLKVPAKALCTECDDLLVGRRQPALNWNSITLVIRDHERLVHGGYSDQLRDALSAGLRALRSGDSTITAGRYQIGELKPD